jgi:hypothetical protein
MSDEKKIIIDEDWKNQVAAEKEAAQRPSQGEPEASQQAGGEGAGGYPPIPASFELLVTTFVSEAMVALGQMPHPANNQLGFDPMHSRFAIDMLEVIAEKTKGNLEPDEERGLHEMLHQLRMAFVAISNQHLAATSQSKIEIP